jgi:ribosomal protein S21
MICFSESFESLSAGLQKALWELGAVPREHRTDSLTAAVHKLTHPEEFTERYRQLLDHCGLEATHSQAGQAHENGDVEQAHHRLKQTVEQELILRGSPDFASRQDYEKFLQDLLRRRNAARQKRLEAELEVMRRLPKRRIEDFSQDWVKVTRNSTIRVRHNTYSVDSRLIGERVQVRVYADHLELFYGQQKMEQMPRLRGEGRHWIQYRHVIHSLVRKPGAFRRYRYREDLFPSLLFRVPMMSCGRTVQKRPTGNI